MEKTLASHLNAEPALQGISVTTAPEDVGMHLVVTDRLPLQDPYNLFLKRTFDILVAVLVICLLLSWLIPLLALMIRLNSKGPVFFLQKRNSRNGKVFSCIKLRTMFVNEEADLVAARDNDERITSVGIYLRKLHLDELPQFLNVFLGDMSVIGPRPYMLSENKYYEGLVHNYQFRHTVKPGISGLAQSYGKFGTIENIDCMKERVAMDFHYIRSWSFMMDIHILLRTLKLRIPKP